MENKLIKYIDENNLNGRDYKEIIKAFSLYENVGLEQVEKTLNKLNREGKILYMGGNNISTSNHLGLIEGYVSGNSKGYAFVEPLDSDKPNLFIPPSKTNSALHGDTVLAIKTGTKKQGDEGEIKYVISRQSKRMVGLFQSSGHYGFVVPDNKRISRDIYIQKRNFLNAKDGHKVVVEITEYENEKSLEGKIIEVLGYKDTPEVELLSIIRDYEISDEFNDDVMNEVRNIPKTVSSKEKEGRVDLTSEKIFTIDGKDAKDLDDAISIRYNKNSGSYHLGVHIADVGHYVKKNSHIDIEAFKRGTSVYLAHKVIPMLPSELSNGICSLHPKTDRLTLSIFMEIDNKGNVINSKIQESVINSIERLNYGDINSIFEGDKNLASRYSNIYKELRLMKDLHKILEIKRNNRGALNFDLPETKIIVDYNTYEVKELSKVERKDSHRIVESFMIIANETIAENYFKNKLPFLYRVHEHPSEESYKLLKDYVARFGIQLDNSYDSISQKDFQNIIKKIDNTQYKYSINKVILRSMQKAKYSSKPIGHFGLAAKYYSHYTSPIRRYPDLTIHRIIKDHISQKINNNNLGKLKKYVDSTAFNSSIREVIAEKCEREVDDYFKAVYMKDKIGNEYKGVISGVISSGIFVELDNSIEGFITVMNLSDRPLKYDEKTIELKNNFESFKIGDIIKICVAASSPRDKRIDFTISKGIE